MKKNSDWNIRFGFATNSSSTHSLLVNSKNINPESYATITDQGFGWESFLLNSKSDKLNYLGQQLAYSLRRKYGMSEEISKLCASGIMGRKIETEGYVDHQSSWLIPINGDLYELINVIKEELSKEDVIILGGNDNDESDKDIPNGNVPTKGILRFLSSNTDVENDLYEQYKTIKIYDEEMNSRTLIFNTKTGTKLVLSGHDIRPRNPELIDVKITNKCNHGCSFCYQNSTNDGKHANEKTLKEFLNWIPYDTLEVAIGGGEPTLHPKLIWFLKSLRTKNIVPSMSTRSIDFFETKKGIEAFKLCGNIALSTNNITHIKKWGKIARDNNRRPIFHYVLGINPHYHLEEFINEINNINGEVLLLKYKGIGRATPIAPFDNSKWFEIAANNRLNIRIDTALAKELAEKDVCLDFLPESYDPNGDGKTSMYIDLVENKFSIDSFSRELEDKVNFNHWSRNESMWSIVGKHYKQRQEGKIVKK